MTGYIVMNRRGYYAKRKRDTSTGRAGKPWIKDRSRAKVYTAEAARKVIAMSPSAALIAIPAGMTPQQERLHCEMVRAFGQPEIV